MFITHQHCHFTSDKMRLKALNRLLREMSHSKPYQPQVSLTRGFAYLRLCSWAHAHANLLSFPPINSDMKGFQMLVKMCPFYWWPNQCSDGGMFKGSPQQCFGKNTKTGVTNMLHAKCQMDCDHRCFRVPTLNSLLLTWFISSICLTFLSVSSKSLAPGKSSMLQWEETTHSRVFEQYKSDLVFVCLFVFRMQNWVSR